MALSLTLWYLYIHTLNLESTERVRQLWGSLYQILAIYGGIIGVLISRHWGGIRSIMGRVILAFSIGLFFQSFGQSVNSYYNFFHNIATPYPSLGDVGFMGSTIMYIYAVVLLSKLSGVTVSFKSFKNKIWAVLIPLAMLIASYLFFLQGYEFDWSNKIKIFLDFGYPFGDAVYVSIALLALFLSKNILGGVMKKPILFLVFALIFQYICDFTFLYQASKGTWYVGGINDFMYFVSYFIMVIGLIYMGSIFQKIKES
jgi:hypothetical protein